jgi:hypothetical protein
MNLTAGIGKLILFIVIVIIGIILVSDGFMARIEQAVSQGEGFARGTLENRAPQITRDFSEQYQESKTEIVGLSYNLWDFFGNKLGAWISERLKPPAHNL